MLKYIIRKLGFIHKDDLMNEAIRLYNLEIPGIRSEVKRFMDIECTEFFKAFRSNINREWGQRVSELEDRLRPNNRQRLEQIKSALDILTKYLNEINERT